MTIPKALREARAERPSASAGFRDLAAFSARRLAGVYHC
jgi:hypothetical protein